MAKFTLKKEETYRLQPYTPLQLSKLFRVSKKTFMTWLKPFKEEIGSKTGHYFSVNQVMVIIEKIGFPGTLMID